jgi:hypothetical protein
MYAHQIVKQFTLYLKKVFPFISTTINFLGREYFRALFPLPLLL